MTRYVNFRCDMHPDPFDCGDCVIFYSSRFDEYGLIIHDGGASVITIEYCPWCGSRLPESKRDLWFDSIERLGLDSVSEESIPTEFLTDAWYATE